MESIREKKMRKRSKSFVNLKSLLIFSFVFGCTRVQGTHYFWRQIFETPAPMLSRSYPYQKMNPSHPSLPKSSMDDRLWIPEEGPVLQWNVCKLNETIANAFKDKKFKHEKFEGIQKPDDWSCLIQHESTFQFGVVGEKNWDRSKDFGTFQFNEKYWCKGEWGYLPGQWRRNECGVPCSQFRDTDLKDDLACIEKVFSESKNYSQPQLGIRGFNPWKGWEDHCKCPAGEKLVCPQTCDPNNFKCCNGSKECIAKGMHKNNCVKIT
jgi:hypothetical protein